MFTIEQIASAHAKVKSGADFPAYIGELKKLGVARYTTFVSDGRTDYSGADGFSASVLPKYQPLAIADAANPERFKRDLKAHQQGQTTYPEFCSDCAASGVEKWIVDLEQLSCTYYDTSGNQILEEKIPG